MNNMEARINELLSSLEGVKAIEFTSILRIDTHLPGATKEMRRKVYECERKIRQEFPDVNLDFSIKM